MRKYAKRFETHIFVTMSEVQFFLHSKNVHNNSDDWLVTKKINNISFEKIRIYVLYCKTELQNNLKIKLT